MVFGLRCIRLIFEFNVLGGVVIGLSVIVKFGLVGCGKLVGV